MKNGILSALLFLFSLSAFATHGQNLGGDITWECQSNGSYVFKIMWFYACDSTSSVLPPDSIEITSNSFVSSIWCTKVSQTDVTPACGTANGISCSAGDVTTVDRIEYESAPLVMPGVPPSSGWDFNAAICCRSTSTNTTNTTFIYLNSTMYAPQGVTAAFPCYDSSPKFPEVPHIFVSSANMQTISFADMQDTDADSVTIEWTTPKGTNGTNITYQPDYSFNQPLPSSTVNPLNVEGILDETSGFYKFSSNTTGRFVYATVLSSYRGGQLVAKVTRELPVIIVTNPTLPGPCSVVGNDVPQITVTSNTHNLLARLNSKNDTTHYEVFVAPGDSLSLIAQGYDIDIKPNCNPQIMSFTASGSALSLDSLYQDENQSAVNGLAATLTSLNTNGGFQSSLINTVQLDWNVEKSHAAISQNGYYQFNVKYMDDHCPIPGTAEMAIRVIVNRPFGLSQDSAMICFGDSASIMVSGSANNLVWSPNTGVSQVSIMDYRLHPTASTLYTVTDTVSGYAETVWIGVGNITTPTIGRQGAAFILTNANTYDSLIWTLNSAPLSLSGMPAQITPTLSGSYQLRAFNGVCIEESTTIDTVIASNFTLNPNGTGEYNGLENADMSHGINVLNLGSSDLNVDYITILMEANNTSMPDVRFRVFDENTNQVFFSDSVSSSVSGQIEIHGSFTLTKGGSYFLSFFFGPGMQAKLFKPFNWPVSANNGMMNIANAAKAFGNVSLPSQFSDSYPFIHFNFNGSIGIDENDVERLEFFPNPTTDILNMPKEDRYEVLDLSGRIIIKTQLTNTINVESLTPGAYIVRNSQGATNKFIKQ